MIYFKRKGIYDKWMWDDSFHTVYLDRKLNFIQVDMNDDGPVEGHPATEEELRALFLKIFTAEEFDIVQ